MRVRKDMFDISFLTPILVVPKNSAGSDSFDGEIKNWGDQVIFRMIMASHQAIMMRIEVRMS
ncbi:hypothetical protein U14_05384 [Candidatus Moduliflexus flocculans]|uniref:Uncharacterized protein n=1 Tax=Candidatus Moduliflexus flocculans TaxID=1499966 RepID=A0A081BRS5_9BACT|nr:hypothetical protein U14_05384 [Candidatus Moduliflexus flocculans]